MAKVTKEDIQEKLDNIDSGYKLISVDNLNVRTGKVTIECKRCNQVMIRSITSLSKIRSLSMCDYCRKEDYKEKIKNSFPIILHGTKYDLIKIHCHDNEKRTYFVSVIDEDGYKFYIEYNRLLNQNNKGKLTKFFYHNPYTLDNIYTFMREHDITDLKILTDNIVQLKAVTLLDVEIKGKIYKISWNDISNNPDRYNRKHIDEFILNIDKRKLSKSDVSNIIMNMYKEKGSPLYCDDFDGETTDTHIGIRLIWKYFGTVQDMQKELGLPVTSDSRILQDDELLADIKQICDSIFEDENRKIITSSDFEKYGVYSNIDRYNRRCKQMGFTLRSYIEKLGYEYQQCGRGMNYKFDDGEVTVSRYEYDFSLFLRENGFVFGKTYFRNILYKELDGEYDGAMTCDYKIVFDNQIIYIELAGILGNTTHQNAYINNIKIESKSKEEYRQKLNRKREIFEKNGLEYYILLPYQMNEKKYNEILTKYQKEVKNIT